MLAVCYLDLDGFKPVNDTWGPASGRLAAGARRGAAAKMVRASDTVSRLGGDEFVIIFGSLANPRSHRNAQAALRLAGRALSARRAKVTVSASVGVTLYPDDEGRPGILIRHADHAMYEARRPGAIASMSTIPSTKRSTKAAKRVAPRHRRPLARNEFRLFYQPRWTCAPAA